MRRIFIILMILTGAAFAAPVDQTVNAEATERQAYTTSLNAMASQLMNWYGSLIDIPDQIAFMPYSAEWEDYRSRYPTGITQIVLIKTDWSETENPEQYQFTVDAEVRYQQSGVINLQKIQETFLFQVPFLAKPILQKVTQNKVEEGKPTPKTGYDRLHYKVREIAYAWLAYMDGVRGLEVIENQLDQAEYDVTISGNQQQGGVADVLVARGQYLSKGGALLRTLDVKQGEDKPDQFTLSIMMEWKGVNQTGKPVLAKIQQEIECQIQENGEWHINKIKEKHLLPDVAPWSGLLC